MATVVAAGVLILLGAWLKDRVTHDAPQMKL